MGKEIKLPDIAEEEQTPLVKGLLGIIEQLAERVQRQEEEIGLLKDEIAVLKGEKKRPRFKASKLDKEAGKPADEQRKGREGKRPGSNKKPETAQLQIHEERVIAPPDQVPEGSRFKGYRDWVVQDLEIRAHNIHYRLKRWETPDGRALVGRLPAELHGRHFGPILVSYMLYQHHHCQVTQPLLREQLGEWRIAISAGQINDLLSEGKAHFHREKDALLLSALAHSNALTVDDTGTRHQGKNAYVTQIGNDGFAWFQTTESKSRINFLQLLRAQHGDYQINAHALAYMRQERLPQHPLQRLLAPELAPKIRVNAVAPSLTDTQLAESLLNQPAKRENAAIPSSLVARSHSIVTAAKVNRPSKPGPKAAMAITARQDLSPR